MDTDLQQQLQPEIDRLHQECLSLIMATVNTNNAPHASYTPFVFVNQQFYVLISGLTLHTRHLLANPALDIMLIEDESKAKNIYARARLNYRATATRVNKDSEEYKNLIPALSSRVGKTVLLLDKLDDFSLFRITPTKGTLVLGFGKAYIFDAIKQTGAIQLTEKNVSQLEREQIQKQWMINQ